MSLELLSRYFNLTLTAHNPLLSPLFYSQSFLHPVPNQVFLICSCALWVFNSRCALPVNTRCDMADGSSSRILCEAFSLMVTPLSCKWKVTGVINPFSPLLYPPNTELLWCTFKDARTANFISVSLHFSVMGERQANVVQ